MAATASIEPGEVADLVMVDGDPLADIRNAREVAAVVKHGRVFDMKTLLSGTVSGRPAARPALPASRPN